MKFLYPIVTVGALLLSIAQTTCAQVTPKNVEDSTISIAMVDISYAFQVPGGNLADRFGNNSMLGLNFQYKTKNNWMFGAGGGFIFGSDIKEDTILKAIATPGGTVITNVGTGAEIYQYQRGYMFTASVGKLIPAFGPNKNTGFVISVGGGFINHKIRIEVADNNVYALSKDYKTGYDRKTNGPCITEFFGYRYMGNRKLLNFFVGAEFTQGFTQNRRPYNFDQMGPDNTKRIDLLYSFKFGWVLPLYRRDPGTYFYN
jgi:hypothetical protein